MLYNYDRVADSYDATRAVPPDAQQHITAALVGALRSGCEEPAVLEVGIGTGRIAAPLAAAGLRVHGIDLSRRMLRLLRARDRRIAAVQSEAGHLPFRDAVFDAVLFVHILHLVPDPGATLREASRVLVDPGIFVLGQTTFDASPLGGIRAEIDAAAQEVIGSPLRTPRRFVDTERYAALLPSLGFEVSPPAIAASWIESTTGRDALDDVALRRNSNTWNIPEESVPEILKRLERRLDGLLGGIDRTYRARAHFELRTARRRT